MMNQDLATSEHEIEGPRIRIGRQWVFRLLAASLSILCLVVLLEILALTRLVDYRLVFSTPFGKEWENPRNRLDPELIHVHQSYESFDGQIRGDLATWFGLDTGRRYPVSVKYDQHGLRNDTDMTSAEMVVVGDSFVEGPIVLKDKITSELLSKSLNEKVLNLGQAGYAPQQELIALQRYGFSLNPKIVVWMIFEGNDLTYDYLRYQYNVKHWDQFVSQKHGFRQRSFTRNLYTLLSNIIFPKRRDQRFGLDRSGVLKLSGPLEGERMYFGYDAVKLSHKDLASVVGGLNVIAIASRECRDRGIKFLVVFAPIKYRVYHNLCSFEANTKASYWELSSLNQRVGDWAKNKQIAYLDLTSPLCVAAENGRLVYFIDDGHWNAEGHAVAAYEIESFIREKNWLPFTP